MAELRWGQATDPGRIRDNNEDNVLAAERLFVVADGMGGHNAGEIASEIAVSALDSRLGAGGITLDDVIAAVVDANAKIYAAATENAEQQGMGTTLTALVVIDRPRDEATQEIPPLAPPTAGAEPSPTSLADPTATDSPASPGEPTGDVTGDVTGDATAATQPAAASTTPRANHEMFAIANVGDSRAYLFRHGRLRRLTVDHSYVQELVATGHITDDEARTHPRRNIVTRALGVDPAVRVDAWTMTIVRDDRFVICSDGLVDEVADADIEQLIASTPDPQATAQGLVDLANRSGGRDNVTVVVVDVVEGADAPDPDRELDLEPAWEDPQPSGSWGVDDVEATHYEDLAALVTQTSDDPTPAGTTPAGAGTPGIPTTDRVPVIDGPATPAGVPTSSVSAVTATQPVPRQDARPAPTPPPPRRRRKLGTFIASVLVFAILTLGFVLIAAWGRHGYFVEFNDNGNVAVFQGPRDGFLWFDPTEEATSELNRDDLDDASIERVERRHEFPSRAAAEAFIDEQLDETTTTSTTTTTTTTTTSTTSTTVAPTTTG